MVIRRREKNIVNTLVGSDFKYFSAYFILLLSLRFILERIWGSRTPAEKAWKAFGTPRAYPR